MKDIYLNSDKEKSRGFTLIEILVVIGIIAVLAAVVLVAVNPARQFKLARNSQRISNVTAILNAIGQNIAEHKGLLNCGANTLAIPSNPSLMTNDDAVTGLKYNIVSCIVPNYISSLPFDPSKAGAGYIENGTYNTGYTISQDTNGRITISAEPEISEQISVTR